jgi:cyclophilin family peptidyl-prolyl cis-trans isomerase
MARGSDPNSGGSSFSILLGSAPHLDMQYTIFG